METDATQPDGGQQGIHELEQQRRDKRAAVACAGRDLPAHYGQLDGVALAGRPCVLLPSPHATAEQVDEGLNFLRNLVSSLPTGRP